MYLDMYFQSLLSVNLTQIFEACGLSSSISYTQYLTPHLGGHLPTFTQKTGPRSSSTLRMLRPSRQARQARQASLSHLSRGNCLNYQNPRSPLALSLHTLGTSMRPSIIMVLVH